MVGRVTANKQFFKDSLSYKKIVNVREEYFPKFSKNLSTGSWSQEIYIFHVLGFIGCKLR